ncbi:UPF0472 protein C16orf72-like protein [Sciurus carolinensis]|uniref:UPF0472 protein C16orf72-like protein n=1 Tax=Sciurus carolinensis TaxID=30640 RepID=A0AA41T5R5_SCICA|nr:UPF0472 protein C16orf72-like protein [Sciurus carolinensis]
MEERKEGGDPGAQAEHWISKWEWQCLAEAEQEEQLSPELQKEAAAAAADRAQAAEAVAPLPELGYRCGSALQRPSVSAARTFSLGPLPKRSHPRSPTSTKKVWIPISEVLILEFRLAISNKNVLAWVKKRRTIRREDLISFLCGKVPPPRNSRAPPRLTVVSPNRATSTETSSSVETDLQPFWEAIALHGLSGAMASISVPLAYPRLSYTCKQWIEC